MPLHPYEIMLAKVWANGLVILVGAAFSLCFNLASATSLGILLATLARSMPQFGLLLILVVPPMDILSGGNTPRESMPEVYSDSWRLYPRRTSSGSRRRFFTAKPDSASCGRILPPWSASAPYSSRWRCCVSERQWDNRQSAIAWTGLSFCDF